MVSKHDGSLDVTIEDLLAADGLTLRPVVMPGHTHEISVSWIHVTEQLDPRPHIRQGELVCTLGSSLVQAQGASTFVSAVSDAGAAGVCLGLGEVHLEPPAELLHACQAAVLPLVVLPHGIPFSAVNDFIMERRHRFETAVRHQEAVLLSELLAQARSGAAEQDLLRRVREQLNVEVGRSEQQEGSGLRILSTAPEADSVPDHDFLTQLSHVLELAARERERAQRQDQGNTGHLMELVAENLAHPAALHRDLERHGLARSPLRASCWPQGSETIIEERIRSAVVGLTSRDVIVLSRPDVETSLQDLGLVCGYSSIVASEDVGRAIHEARAALALARQRGAVSGPAHLVSLEVLLEQQPLGRLTPFAEVLLAPLTRADATGGAELLRTLEVFFDENCALQATAQSLYVHVNTVRNRLAKVQSLTGRSPLNPKESVDLRIALWAKERRSRRIS